MAKKRNHRRAKRDYRRDTLRKVNKFSSQKIRRDNPLQFAKPLPVGLHDFYSVPVSRYKTRQRVYNPPEVSTYQTKPKTPPRALYGQINDIKRVKVCLRRSIRKEIMHAFGHAGTGSRVKKPHFDNNSKIRC